MGVSGRTGIMDTSGGASVGPEAPAIFGRSLSTGFITGLVIGAGCVPVGGRFCSIGSRISRVFEAVGAEDAADAAATAEVRGAANEFLTREKSDDTRVYEDSCSSSSEKGLKLVRLVTSSTTLVELLLDFRGPPFAEVTVGDVG